MYEGKHIFIHCIGGNHRAATLAAAVIMITEGIKFIDALWVVTAAKPCRIDEWLLKITKQQKQAISDNLTRNSVQDWVVYWWQFAALGDYFWDDSMQIGYVAMNHTHPRFKLPSIDAEFGLTWECKLPCAKPRPKFTYFAIDENFFKQSVVPSSVTAPSPVSATGASSSSMSPQAGSDIGAAIDIGARLLQFLKRASTPACSSYTIPGQQITQAWTDIVRQELLVNFTFLCQELRITSSTTGANPLTSQNLVALIWGSLFCRLPAHGVIMNILHIECVTNISLLWNFLQ